MNCHKSTKLQVGVTMHSRCRKMHQTWTTSINTVIMHIHKIIYQFRGKRSKLHSYKQLIRALEQLHRIILKVHRNNKGWASKLIRSSSECQLNWSQIRMDIWKLLTRVDLKSSKPKQLTRRCAITRSLHLIISTRRIMPTRPTHLWPTVNSTKGFKVLKVLNSGDLAEDIAV